MNTVLNRPEVRTIEWRDLLEMSRFQKIWELTLSLPWLLLSLYCYQHAYWIPGAFCSFYFFLTGLRQSHGAQHYTLGINKTLQDVVLFVLSNLMLGSMHAVQVSHLHHHRHCLDDDDAEGSTARLRWWQAFLVGPLFYLRLHHAAWKRGAAVKRRWIAAEIASGIVVVLAAIVVPNFALRGHVIAMLVGESMTGFFAVWTVHHGCDSDGLYARTQRGRWINLFCYSMFYHAEHHLFPLVPTCHLSRLAIRLDAAVPEFHWKQVIGAPLGTGNRDLQPKHDSACCSGLGL